jgi:hypothetical protein
MPSSWCKNGLALLWQIFSGTGFPNQYFCDSWVVGFWRADHGGNASELEDELGRWLKPFLDRLGHRARVGAALRGYDIQSSSERDPFGFVHLRLVKERAPKQLSIA